MRIDNGEWRIEEGEEEVEGIGDAVGEATEDEDGDTEEEGEHLTLAGELDGGGHDETATDGEPAPHKTDTALCVRDAAPWTRNRYSAHSP